MFVKTKTFIVFALILIHYTQCQQAISGENSPDFDNNDQARLLVQIVKFHQAYIQRIKSITRDGQAAQAVNLLNAYLNNNSIPCQLKKNFINITSEILKDKLGQNTFQLNKLKLQLDGVDNMPDFYQNSKRELQNIKNQLEKFNYESDIRKLQQQIKGFTDNFANQSQASNRYLNQLKGLEKSNANGEKVFDVPGLQKLLSQMKTIDQSIDAAIGKRQKILKDISQMKISMLYQQINNIKNGSTLRSKQDEYRTNSNLAAETRAKFKNKQDQIQRVKSEKDRLQRSTTPFDIDLETTTRNLDQLRRLKQDDSLQKVSILLKSNIKTLGQRIRSFERDCLVS